MSVQFEKNKSFPSTRLKMYRGSRLEGSGKIHLNSIFSVLNCLKEGYNDSPSFFHTIIHFNSVLKKYRVEFPSGNYEYVNLDDVKCLDATLM